MGKVIRRESVIFFVLFHVYGNWSLAWHFLGRAENKMSCHIFASKLAPSIRFFFHISCSAVFQPYASSLEAICQMQPAVSRTMPVSNHGTKTAL